MNEIELRYALAKQVESAFSIETDFGRILLTDLDHDARDRIKAAVQQELERALASVTRREG